MPTEAWALAAADAAARGEPQIPPPVPTLAYPFGAQCRACLRDAATNPQRLPWRSAFRGDFDVGTESQDTALRLTIRGAANGLRTRLGHGIDFTLEGRNDGTQPVPVPTHVGPEFGTLVVSSSTGEGAPEYYFAPDGYRCSSARQAVVPGKSIFRSFSIVPAPHQAFLDVEGTHTLRVKLNSSDASGRLQLGVAEARVDVYSPAGSRGPAAVATELIGAARGMNAVPRRQDFNALEQLADVPMTPQLLITRGTNLR